MTSDNRTDIAFEPGLRGLLAMCEALDEPLAAYQRRIARTFFGPEREAAVVIGRGNAKTTTAALIGLHHLLTVPGAMVTLGAASRDQARIAYERMRGFAQHPALDGALTVRHLELRRESDDGHLRVVASDAGRAHGLSSSLYIADELWAWPDKGLLEAFQTGLVKRPDAKLLVISTAAASLDTPLGRLRARALAQPTAKRHGPIVTASGGIAWLEWSLDEDTDLSDLAAVGRCNPAPWITRAALARQHAALPETAFAQFHAGRWGSEQGSWLPAGAWQACIGAPAFTPGEPIWIGVDVGGERSATAVSWVNAQLHAGIAIFHGDQGVIDALDQIRDLAATYSIREVVFDPWRFGQAAAELERERLVTVAFPQTDQRMIPASAALHAAITEQRLTVPDEPELHRHVANSVARHSRRGWRIDKPGPRVNNDAVIALAMAVDRAQSVPEPARLVAWL